MRPVMQRGDSDCLRACLASIFDVGYEDAPDTSRQPGQSDEDRNREQHNAVNDWLRDRGLVEWIITDEQPANGGPVLRRGVHIRAGGGREPANFVWPYPTATRCVGSGPSPRGGRDHAVVMYLGSIEHDPHPDQDMTIDRITTLHVYAARL